MFFLQNVPASKQCCWVEQPPTEEVAADGDGPDEGWYLNVSVLSYSEYFKTETNTRILTLFRILQIYSLSFQNAQASKRRGWMEQTPSEEDHLSISESARPPSSSSSNTKVIMAGEGVVYGWFMDGFLLQDKVPKLTRQKAFYIPNPDPHTVEAAILQAIGEEEAPPTPTPVPQPFKLDFSEGFKQQDSQMMPPSAKLRKQTDPSKFFFS